MDIFAHTSFLTWSLLVLGLVIVAAARFYRVHANANGLDPELPPSVSFGLFIAIPAMIAGVTPVLFAILTSIINSK